MTNRQPASIASLQVMVGTSNCPARRDSQSRRRSRPGRLSGVGGAGASVLCATGGGGLNDENCNHANDDAIEDVASITGEAEQDDCVLDLAGTIDGLIRASSSGASSSSVAAADPLFHSSRNLAFPSALSAESRSKSIAAAHRMFHHDDVVAHDDEVRAGAFDALVFRLGFSVGLLAASSLVSGAEGEQEQGTSRQDEVWSELSQIASTLSQVCKCSHSYRLATFNSAGRDQLFLLLFHMMRSGRDVLLQGASENTSPSVVKNASEAIVGSLAILRSYCKVSDIRPQFLKPTVAKHLLPCLADLMKLCARNKNAVDWMNIEKDTLGLLKDVTHRCSETEARIMVVGRHDLLETALEIGILANKSSNGRASHRLRKNEYLATLLWNCASQRSVRAALLSLGEDEGCTRGDTSLTLSFLSSVLSFDNDSRSGTTTNDDNDGDVDFELQKAALSCLGNLCRGMQEAAENTDDGRVVLAHDGGIFVQLLLSIATDAPASSSLVCRRRAVRTIRCLVRATSNENNAVGGNNCVSAVLRIASQRRIDVVRQLLSIMKNDEDENVQIHAAESLATLYHMLASNMELNVDKTIEVMNSSFICVLTSTAKNVKLTEIACRCLSSVSTLIDLNNQSADLFPSLLGIFRLHNSDSDESHKLRLSSLKLIRVLSTVETNRPIMLREEGFICSDNGDDEVSFGLLHCLSLILKPSGKDFGDGAIGSIEKTELQKEAAGILVELAGGDSAQSVVDYPDLLSSFTHYCTSSVGSSGPERDEAKKALMRLVAKL